MHDDRYQQAKNWADNCRIFSNAHRVLIIWALSGRELSVSKLAEEIHTTMQNTSQHLRLMKDTGFVNARREGQSVYYKIADNSFFEDFAILKQSFPSKEV